MPFGYTIGVVSSLGPELLCNAPICPDLIFSTAESSRPRLIESKGELPPLRRSWSEGSDGNHTRQLMALVIMIKLFSCTRTWPDLH